MNSQNTSSFQAWSMWAVAMSFFAYQFIMRLFPGLVMHDVLREYQVDATSFGVLSSMYYFGYAGMQIPIAILLDRFGPRVVITISSALCAAATLLFVSANSWSVLLLARFLIGVGSTAGFLGTSKVISMVFPEHQYSKMVGLTFSFGLMGAVFGGKPVGMLVTNYSWQSVGAMIAVFGFLCTALVWFIVKPSMKNSHADNYSVFDSLKTIFKNPFVLSLALANLLMVGSLEGLADVWGVPFFMKMFTFEKADAAFVISFVFFGMLFGGPLLVSIANRISNDYIVASACGFCIALLFAVLLGGLFNFSYVSLCCLLFFVGIFGCYQVIVLCIGSKLAKPEHKGITVAFLNSVNMFGGSFFHLVIGTLLDFVWDGADATLDGAKVYSAIDYKWALSSVPLCALLGGVLVLLIGYLGRSKGLRTEQRS